MTIKTTNSIFKDIITILNQAFSVMGIQDWEIVQLLQPVKDIPSKPTVFIQITNFKNEGWQFSENKVVNNSYKHIEHYISKFDLKISCFRRREITDTENTLNGSDIIENIKSFLLSQQGIQYIRSLGYNIYIPQQLDIADFVDDSDNFELIPSLIINFTFNQEWSSNQNIISGFDYIINKV